MSPPPAVVLGIGNEFRRDDGVGPAAAAEIRRLRPSVRVLVSDGEPATLVGEWAAAGLAIVVDALVCEPCRPGRIRRFAPAEVPTTGTAGSHSLGLAEAARLGQVLGRMPARLVVFAVEVANVGFGIGLTPAVAAALPGVVSAVAAELDEAARGAVSRP